MKKRGFTLTELAIVIALLGVLSVGGSFLLLYLVENSLLIPQKLGMEMAVSDAMDIMIEGDNLSGGLRFSREVTEVGANAVSFINQDHQTVRCLAP